MPSAELEAQLALGKAMPVPCGGFCVSCCISWFYTVTVDGFAGSLTR